ncbi:exosome nuclease subunit [Serendipita sp. 401]|nr:exosome nuclease subunit [Serendipita sp. 401]
MNGLRASEELAIDLEHHSYRSYYGFVCLMQISNRSRDWIIDCLVPDIRSNMELLNEVFTDPGIIKVFHGAGHDIIWLQENFNIYIVNLFDTYHASRLLEFPKFSLAFLLSKYCGFTADKRYQLADWRIRPLPQEMIHYARSDTHFLLFIYDSLREDLLQIDRSKITDGAPHDYESVKRVLKDSEETSLKEAAWEPYDTLNGEGTKGWAGLVRKTNKPELATPGPSRNVFLAIHRWRDSVAREEDESPLFVLSNQALLSIVEKVPTDLSSLYDLFGNFVPISIRKKGPELLKVIQDASLAAPMVIRDQAETFSGPDTTGKQDTRKKEAGPQVTVFSTKPTPTIGLWSSSLSGVTSVPSKPPIAQNSSLFGSVLKSPHPISRNEQGTVASSRSLLTQTSVLLGNRPFVTGGSGPNLGISRTLESITRIHDSILNSQRKAVTFQTTTSRHVGVAVSNKRDTKPQMSTSRPLVPNTQTTPPNQPVPPTEIEFVPRSQRDTIADNDDIVTVGFRKQKRKRPDGESDVEQRKKNRYSRLESFGTNSGSTSNPRDLPVDDVKTFDYDGAPNILDEGMKDLKGERQGRDVSKKERKEARKNQGTKLDFKGFAPAPRKTNEPKSGNKSITYR